MAGLFTSDGKQHRTNIVLLEGDQYMPVLIQPASGSGRSINNDDFNIGGIAAFISGANFSCTSRTMQNYTLGTDVYLYTFGEALWNISISGMGYIPCYSDTPSINDLIDFYDVNNIGKHGKYCTLIISNKTFKAYLTSGEIGATNEALGVFPFKFEFVGLLQSVD